MAEPNSLDEISRILTATRDMPAIDAADWALANSEAFKQALGEIDVFVTE